MTEADYIDVMLTLAESYNAVFNFWLTITFSFLVATYLVSGKLSAELHKVLAGLYSVASAIFIIRFASLVSVAAGIRERIHDAGFIGIPEPFE